MNYPNKKNNINNNIITYGNRGMDLESDINNSNKYYLENDIAVIYKKPTPIKVVKVNYNKRINTKITEAYYEIPSTTDYNGIYKGRYIDFEAKECASKTAFPLSSIHAHQIEHLRSIESHGGISFLIVRFTELNETYYVKAIDLFSFLETNDRKSIPYSWFKDSGYIIPESYLKPVDYLEVLEKLYFEEGSKE